MAALASAAFFFAGLPARANTSPLAIAGDGQTQAADCRGAAVELSGSHNTITLHGACSGLRLRGDGNAVTVELAPGAALDIQGGANVVHSSLAAGAPPAVTAIGSGTQLNADGDVNGIDAAGPISLTGDRQRMVLDCTGQSVTIQANHGDYTLRGGCAGLVAHGDGNAITATLRAGASAVIEGNGTTLTYAVAGNGTAPPPVVRGANSQAVAAAAAAPSPRLPPPSPAPMPQESVPQLMDRLQARVVSNGTLVSLHDLFGADAALRSDSGERIRRLAALFLQIHPSGLRLTGIDTDPALADQRARAVAASLAAAGVAAMPEIATETGAPRVDAMILR